MPGDRPRFYVHLLLRSLRDPRTFYAAFNSEEEARALADGMNREAQRNPRRKHDQREPPDKFDVTSSEWLGEPRRKMAEYGCDHLGADPGSDPAREWWGPWLRERLGMGTKPTATDGVAQPAAAAVSTNAKVVDYINMDQASALVNRSKKTLEGRLKQGKMPPPDIEGGGGKPHEWQYAKLRPWLEEEFARKLPDRPPHSTR
jgi:hypothetical protein